MSSLSSQWNLTSTPQLNRPDRSVFSFARFSVCLSVWSSVCHRRIFPSGKKLTSVNFPSDSTMSLSPCQEFFSHTPNFFHRPSAPLRPPFFHVCQVFFRISSSNFLSSFCQEIFCQVQIFSFLIFKNVKKFLRSKLYRPRFRGFVKRFFHLSSSKTLRPFFAFVKYYFHKSSSKNFLLYPEYRRIIIL